MLQSPVELQAMSVQSLEQFRTVVRKNWTNACREPPVPAGYR
jgi:hypothetical protein